MAAFHPKLPEDRAATFDPFLPHISEAAVFDPVARRQRSQFLWQPPKLSGFASVESPWLQARGIGGSKKPDV